jgi:hypothetical protein
MRLRSRTAAGLLWSLAAGCGPPGPPDVPSVVATMGPLEACVEAEAVEFAWAIEPVPEDISLEVECVLGAHARIDGGVAVPLECAEADGTRARTLYLWAQPGPPTAGLRAGAAVRLRAYQAAGPGADADAFVRLEAQDGGLVVAGAAAGALAPPDGTDLWPPFMISPATSACLSEETACGTSQRGAVDVRRAGGAPTIVLDASEARVGDRGEAQLWVAGARRGDPACLGGALAWYSVGLMATR